MNVANESERAETPIGYALARVAVAAVAIVVAAWLATSYALDWLGAPLLN
jgi:hypothetical protein